MLSMQPATLRSTLEQLEQATRDHLEWHADLLRVIVCELPGDPNDVDSQAHHLCRFGRWYYQLAVPELRDAPAFAAIGVEHRRVHQVATGILRDIAAGRPVRRSEFDELLDSSLRLRAELEQLRREVQAALRSRDALTGAYDRELALPELRRWRASAAAGATPCCVVLMDLDRLQAVNARHGHPLGDAVLAEAVRYVREHLRPADKVFRYGGDEFLISLPGTDLTGGREVVTRIRDGLARCQLFIAGADPAWHLTASFGIALLDPAIRVDDSIEHAAQALLVAKAAGGNRLVAWDPSITTGRHWRRLEVNSDH